MVYHFSQYLPSTVSGWLQTIATVGKLVPLLFMAIGGWLWFDSSLLSQSYNVSQMGNLNAFSAAASLCLWAFIGLESASIPAGQGITLKEIFRLPLYLEPCWQHWCI